MISPARSLCFVPKTGAPKRPAEEESAAPRAADRFERGSPFPANLRPSPAPASGVIPANPDLPPAPTKPPFGPPPASDPNAAATYKLLSDDNFIKPEDSKRIVEMARSDAKLGPSATDAELRSATNDLLIRAGSSGTAARGMAAEVVDGAKSNNYVKIDNSPGKPMTFDEFKATFPSTEARVAKNKAADKVWSKDQIAKNPTEFVRNVTQIDGDQKTANDRHSCVPTSLVAGSILKDPTSGERLGKALRSAEGQKNFPGMKDEPYKSAVDRMASGSYSARDVSVVSRGLHDDVETRDRGLSTGRKLEVIGKLEKSGWRAPEMQVNAWGSHAIAKVGDTTYDPWPYSGGRAVIAKGAAGDQHGRTFIGRYDRSEQNTFTGGAAMDGNGGVVLTDVAEDGKRSSARYTLDASKTKWVRDPGAPIDPSNLSGLPPVIALDRNERAKVAFE